VNGDFAACPGCGQKVFRGAMRCTGCGRTLMSPEEQLEKIRRIRESGKPSITRKFIKLVLLLIVIGIIYTYSDVIAGFIRTFLGR
jgi:uncharacterized membrane protein YvbJ